MPRTRRLAASAFFAASLLLPGSVRAARASTPPAEPDFIPFCMAGATQKVVANGIYPIPDATTGTIIGTLPTPADGTFLETVMVALEINHTFVGDLVIRIAYVNCATGDEIYGTDLICRPRGTQDEDDVPCGPDNGFGCSGNLGRSPLDIPQPASQRYWFSEESTNVPAMGSCPPELGSGCYHPWGNLPAFTGLPRGGCWRLIVSDWKPGDTGSVTSWAVWERDADAVPAHHSSWGELKVLYR